LARIVGGNKKMTSYHVIVTVTVTFPRFGEPRRHPFTYVTVTVTSRRTLLLS
jgi:hypothetical protein